MLFIGIISMILTASMTITIFHKAFDRQIKTDIRQMAVTLSTIYNGIDDYSDLEAYSDNGIRITLIGKNGDVLFDSDGDESTMENHSLREEIIAAMETGSGEAMRHSDTMGYNTYYYAELLPDGNILRTATNVATMYADYNNTMPMVIVIGILILFISVCLSQMLTKKLVAPIEAMAENIDDIDKDIPYKELEPFALAIKEYHTKKDESSKMRQEFTANVSHELKTPLTSISGYAEMIENGMVKDSDIKVFAGKIHTEAHRLIVLIGDILKLSELDEPNRCDNCEPVDLYKLAEHTIEMLALNAEKSKIKLFLCGNGAVINGSKLMLSELIYNLCDNAIRYNKIGGYIKIKVSSKDGKAYIDIKDNGIGIPKEYQDRIFERFFRVDKSRSKETGGTGLGLAIVKHIAIQHNGCISVESRVDEGTTMHVVLKGMDEKVP